MQQSRFVVLTGHLNDYPLPDLFGILRHQQKTGRLLIEYPKAPAIFFFQDGELVDAQLDKLKGLQAICVALAQPASSFNFNPLIQPTRRSIENSLQKVVYELLGCWDEKGLAVETIASGRTVSQPALLARPALPFAEAAETTTDQALVFSSVALEVPRSRPSRPVMAMAAAGLMMLGLSTVIAVSGGFGKRDSSNTLLTASPAAVNVPAPPQSSGELTAPLPTTEPRNDSGVQRKVAKTTDAPMLSRQENRISSIKKGETDRVNDSGVAIPSARAPLILEEGKKANEVPNTQSVKVVLQIESGRVSQASIANHRTGMDAYEALALRIARQRRYPSKVAGQETVVIKVGN